MIELYLIHQTNNMEQTLPQIKVIVVGASGVGKSSILFRFVNDEFNEFSEATLGAAFVSKIHTYGDNKTIRFQVIKLLFMFGIQQGSKSINQSLPSIIDVVLLSIRISNRIMCLRYHQKIVFSNTKELG